MRLRTLPGKQLVRAAAKQLFKVAIFVNGLIQFLETISHLHDQHQPHRPQLDRHQQGQHYCQSSTLRVCWPADDRWKILVLKIRTTWRHSSDHNNQVPHRHVHHAVEVVLHVMLPIDRSAPYHYQNFLIFRGCPMHGMIVDTGAAKAIMGTDTMKEYITDIFSRYGKVIKINPSESRFTGIGGRQEKSEGLAETLLGIPLPGVAEVTIDLDLLGDMGSQCPDLLPLSVMLRLQSSILCGVLQGGDGIMILRILDNDPQSRSKRIPRTFFVQLYLTDFCHY
eukprot:2050830-Pyramimonas_sp.AAC.2